MTRIDASLPLAISATPPAPTPALTQGTVKPVAPEVPAGADVAVPYESSSLEQALENARTVELEQPYAAEEDGGRDLEVAMASVVFDDLQRAGLIDPKAQLATKLEPREGVQGKTYESRLVALIQDADKNGKLDLDLDRLAKSGILSKDATPAQLQKALGDGAPHDGLTREFIKTKGGDAKSGLAKFGQLNDRGESVRAYSINMTLSTDMDRAVQSAVEKFESRAAKSPAAGQTVAEDAISLAAKLRAGGDAEHASRLLDGTGAALTNTGRYDDARRVFDELAAAPNAGDPVNLARPTRDSAASYNREHKLVGAERNGNSTTIVESSFDSKWSDVAERRSAQVDLAERMSAVLGRPADPRKIPDAREYFGKLSSMGASNEELGREFQSYLQTRFVHSGDGVKWTSNIPRAERGARVEEMFADQPKDALGRTVIDCEGFAALTDHLFRDAKDANGKPRFDVLHAGKKTHVIAGVFEKNAGGGFVVNNANTALVPENTKTRAAREEALGRSLADGFYEVLSIGSDPEAAAVCPVGKNPKLGARIWAGDRFSGTVDQRFIDRYSSGEGFGLSLSKFVGRHYSD